MSLAIPEAVCPGRTHGRGEGWCPRRGVPGTVNSIGLCPACSKDARRAAARQNGDKAYEKSMKQDYATHGNFLKMLSIVDTLRGILTEVESQTIRTIVRRHLIDFAVELGDAPAGMDALRPPTAAEAIAAKIAAAE